jgi:hypothetical protein
MSDSQPMAIKATNKQLSAILLIPEPFEHTLLRRRHPLYDAILVCNLADQQRIGNIGMRCWIYRIELLNSEKQQVPAIQK